MSILRDLTFVQVVYLVVAGCILAGSLIAVAVLASEDHR